MLKTNLYLSDLTTQIVWDIKTDKLMLYGETIDVCSEIHTKHINELWAEHRISLMLKLAVHTVSLKVNTSPLSTSRSSNWYYIIRFLH
jgi:hypothetical protein